MIFSDPFLFAISLLDTAAVLFLNIYFIIVLTDLESDYINAQECCSKLNFWVTPKFMAHTFLMFMFLTHGYWTLFFLNLPLALWISYEFFRIPKGNLGIYDPTEIHTHRTFKKHLRDCMIHLAYYLIFFFLYLYRIIVSLLEGDPINRKDEDLVEF